MKEPFSNVLQKAWVDVHDPQVGWQVAILLSCFVLAWATARALRFGEVEADGIWKFGVGGLRRILFPVVALIPLALAISLLRHRMEVDLLRLFVPLLLSLLLVRLFFYLLRFADSGIDLQLGVWIDDPENGMLGIRSELFLEIWRAFREAGIEIPFPQREVRILPNASGVPD